MHPSLLPSDQSQVVLQHEDEIVVRNFYHLLQEVGRVQPGETVLIHAASGGIGTTAIQIAKILGAGKVIGTVGNDAKKETAKQAGADFVVNNKEQILSSKFNNSQTAMVSM